MHDSDERLRQAIRAGNIGIFEHDHVTDALYWSPELRRMYGWDADEPAILPKIIGHVHPEDVGQVVAAVRAVIFLIRGLISYLLFVASRSCGDGNERP